MEKLLIIDGNSLVNRAFYALPLLTNSNGEYSNAVYGFTNILVKFINEQKPDYICVAFDHSRHTFRTEMYQAYKGTRKQMPDELRSQMPILKDLLSKMNIKTFEVDKIEADDIIGTVAKNSGVNNIILSGDRDVLQLIDANTQVWLTKKGISDVTMVDETNIRDIYDVLPSQIIDLKALMGDSSDNIPGVTGVGEKIAKTLIRSYKTLDGVYENIDKIKGKLREKLIAGKEDAYLSYKLASIKTDCKIKVNVKDFSYDFPFNNSVREVFEKYEFKSLLKRNEIFSKEAQKPIIKQTTETISSIEQLKQILNQKIEFFAFNFVNKLEFCINQSTVYNISMQTTLFEQPLNLDDVFKQIEPVLSNEKIQKITYDLKSHMHLNPIFSNIKGNLFDISIAIYLVHAGQKIGVQLETGEYYFQKTKLTQELKKHDLDFVYNQIEMPLTYVLFDMEQNGFNIDKDILKQLSNKYSKELKTISQNIYNLAYGEFNINSPKQVANVLFEVLGLSDANNKKRSTGIEYLNMLKNEHAIVPLIIRYRKIQKLYCSYLEPYTKLVEEKGECIHTIFNQTQTATGRLSSSEPNLQNIPVREEEGKLLRKIFVSRFKNGQIVTADYNQIELRLLASLSNDYNLIDAYNNGEDIHKSTAAQIFGKSIQDVTSEERSMAKAVNFGIIYGISAYGLANQIGEPTGVAKKFIDKYLGAYPMVTAYMQNNINFAKEHVYSKTIFGRIRKINEINSSNKNIVQFAERVAMNMPLQGTASDIIKIAMIKVSKKLKEQNLKSKLILQIHDELIIDATSDEVEQVKSILTECMESVVELTVPLIVNISSGKTWFDAK